VDRPSADRLAETFEIETYTFPVLPDGPEGDAALVEAIAAEFRWTREVRELIERPYRIIYRVSATSIEILTVTVSD